MARKLTLSDKEVLALVGKRQLNPALLDLGLDALRSIYLGVAYSSEVAAEVISGKEIPLNKYLLDPDLAEKLSDDIGPVNLATLQKMVETAGLAVNRGTEVANRITSYQNRLADLVEKPLGTVASKSSTFLPRLRYPQIPKPYSGKFLSGASHLFFVDSLAENERRKEKAERIRQIGADIDPDNAAEMIKHATRIMAESQWLAEKISPVEVASKALGNVGALASLPRTYAALVNSNEFKSFQDKLNKEIDADYADLEKMDTFKQYKKAWPIAGDSLFAAFVGAKVTSLYIPIRESVTMALVAGSDPAVRKIAMGLASGEDQSDESWHNLFTEINRSVTNSIKTGDWPNARYVPEIASQAVLTAPAVWDKLGIHNPSMNYIAEGLQGMKWGARSLRQRLEGGVVKRFLNFIEDKDQLKFEDFQGQANDWLTSTFGPKYGAEMIDKLQTQFKTKLEGLTMNVKGRSGQALAWRGKMIGTVRAALAPLTKEEQLAAIRKVQHGKKFDSGVFDGFSDAPEEIKKVWDNEFVDGAVKYMRDGFERVRMFDPQLPADPHYFTASEIRGAQTGDDLVQKYAARGYLKTREFTQAVIPTLETLDQNIINFADRLAGPQFLEFVSGTNKSARTAASTLMDVVAEAFQQPEKYLDDIAGMFNRVQYPKRSGEQVRMDAFNAAYSTFQNSILLTSRPGSWLSRNVLDDSARFAANVWDNFKAGKIPSRQSLREASSKTMPPELYDGMFSRILMDDADPVALGQLNMLNRGYNDFVFDQAEMLQRKGLKLTATMNYAAEKETYLARHGLKELTDEGERIVTGRAVESARDYMLANQVNSAFTSNLGTKLLISYPGFFMRSTSFLAKQIGRSPELFTAGARISRMLFDSNQDQPGWDKHRLIAFGRSHSSISALSMFPLVKTIAHIDYARPKTDQDSLLEKDFQMMRSLTPGQQIGVLEKRPDLRAYASRNGLRAIGTYVESMMDLNVMPIGVVGKAAAEYFRVIEKRSPYWMIGSKELEQFGRAVGLDKISIEGRLNPTIGAWEKANFEIGAMTNMVMGMRKGEYTPEQVKEANDYFAKDPKQRLNFPLPEMYRQASNAYRNERMDDLIFNRFAGFGKVFDADIQKFNNDVARYSFTSVAEDYVTPPPDEVERVKKLFGLDSDEKAEFLWKSNQMFSSQPKKQIDAWRKKQVKEYPYMDELAGMWKDRSYLKTMMALRDKEELINDLPESLRAKVTLMDKVANAFNKIHNGQYVMDGSGRRVYKFDANQKAGDIFLKWKTSEPSRKTEMLKDPAVGPVVRQLDPSGYAKHSLILGQKWVIPAETTVEEDVRTEQSLPLSEIFERALMNPSGAPMDIFDAYLSGKPELIKKADETIGVIKEKIGGAIDAINKFGASFNPFVVPEVGAAEFEPVVGGGFKDAGDADTEAVLEAREAVRKFVTDVYMKHPVSTKGPLASTEEQNDFTEKFRNYIMDADPQIRTEFRKGHNDIWKSYAYERHPDDELDDQKGRLVGATDSPEGIDYINRLNRSLADPYATQQTFKDLIAQGRKPLYGKPLIDRLQNDGRTRALIKTIQYQAEGNQYALGVQRNPNFNLNTEEGRAAHNIYLRTSFRYKDETLMQHNKRFIQETRAMSKDDFDKYAFYLRRQGYTEMPELLSEVRASQSEFFKLPVDRQTQRRIEDFREQMPFIEDDPLALRNELAKDPDLTSTILHHEPRLYKTLQSKLFSPYDKSWKAYLQNSQYSPEAINYMKRLAPQTYARLYWKDPDFRGRMDTLGYPQPQPSAETSVSRNWTDADGNVQTRVIPDVLTPPEPIAPDPVPRGTFGSLPVMLNYAAQDARDEFYRLNVYQNTLRAQGQELPPSDQEFLRMSPKERIFARFPSLIARGFREGQLAPEEVIGQLKGVSQFALTTGAIAPERHASFNQFLDNTTNVVGATRFGFQMGSFLDEAFNIPRIPVSNAYLDFVLAGQPVSTVPRPMSPAEIAARNISTTAATPLVPINSVRASYRTQLPAFNDLQTTPGLTAEGEAMSAAAAGSGAAAGLPGVGVVFATISAGFTIANILKSSRQRKRAKGEAARNAAERERQLAIARAEAQAERDAASNRQVAGERYRILQAAESVRRRDYDTRLQRVLADGASFASLSQQPREFINRFVADNEPEVIQFTRSPQFDSRVGLVAQIAQRLPKARY